MMIGMMMMVMICTLTTMMRTMVVGLMMTSNFRLQAPGPSWPHVLRAVLCHGLILPTAIMAAFLMTEGCGNLQVSSSPSH